MSLYFKLIFIYLVNYCNCLKYSVPQLICNNQITGIAIGKKLTIPEAKDLPELAFISAKGFWYFPDPQRYIERYWMQVMLPPDLEKGSASFKRNFFIDWVECKAYNADLNQMSSQFFLIDFVNNKLVYDVFDVMNKSWVFDGEEKQLKDHYLFSNSKIDMDKEINASMAWNQNIIVFQGDQYFVIQLEQKICDETKNMSETVKHLGPNPIKDIDGLTSVDSAIYYSDEGNKLQELYVFQNPELFYYNNPIIEASGKISVGKQIWAKNITEEFFDCQKPKPITLPQDIVATADDSSSVKPSDEPSDVPSENTEETSDVDKHTENAEVGSGSPTDSKDSESSSTSKPDKKKFAIYLIAIIIISIIIVPLLCLFCCFCMTKKNTTDEDQEAGGKDKKDKKDEKDEKDKNNELKEKSGEEPTATFSLRPVPTNDTESERDEQLDDEKSKEKCKTPEKDLTTRYDEDLEFMMQKKNEENDKKKEEDKEIGPPVIPIPIDSSKDDENPDPKKETELEKEEEPKKESEPEKDKEPEPPKSTDIPKKSESDDSLESTTSVDTLDEDPKSTESQEPEKIDQDIKSGLPASEPQHPSEATKQSDSVQSETPKPKDSSDSSKTQSSTPSEPTEASQSTKLQTNKESGQTRSQPPKKPKSPPLVIGDDIYETPDEQINQNLH